MPLDVDRKTLEDLCRAALLEAGADHRDAEILAEATVEAELLGNRAVGVGHLFDYLDSYQHGRIAAPARAVVRRVAPAVVDVDAAQGLAQTAYADAATELHRAVREAGLAALWIRNSFTCGELGYYVRRVAGQGLLALAAANSSALMSLGGAPRPVLGTNPLAYGIPRPGQLPVVIDQASSSTAYVNVRRAAESDDPIPAGWAVGPDGEPTRDAAVALQGALLPFGGHRGGNVALLVEILATLSGASFSMDTAPFDRGTTSPDIGVFLLAIDPATFGGSAERLVRLFARLRDERRVRLPAVELTSMPTSVEVSAQDLDRLRRAAASG